MKKMLSLLLTVILLLSSIPLPSFAEDIATAPPVVDEAPATQVPATEAPTSQPAEEKTQETVAPATEAPAQQPTASPVKEEPAASSMPTETPVVTQTPVPSNENPPSAPTKEVSTTEEPAKTELPETTAEPTPEVTATQEPVNYSFAATPDSLDFGTMSVNAQIPIQQEVIIINDGNAKITLQQPTSKNYNLGALSALTLSEGDKASFSIVPKTNLKAGKYTEKIVLSSDEGKSITISLMYTVAADATNMLTANSKAILPAPTGFVANNWTFTSSELKWNAVSGASRYELYRSDSYSGSYGLITTTTSLRYIDSYSVVCGNTYYYRIRAIDSTNEAGVFSDTIVTTVLPVVSSLLTATSYSSTQIRLTWAKGVGATGYYIWRSPAGAGNFTRIATVPGNAVLSYIDSNLTTNTPYSYKIQTYYYQSSTGKTFVSADFSNTLTATAVPTAPSNLVATSMGYNTISLKWTASVNVSNYNIYRSDAINGNYVLIGTTATNSFTDQNSIQTGVSYFYKITSVTDGVQSPYSSIATAAAIPVAPTGLYTVSVSDSAIKLFWNTSLTSGYSGYVIEQRNDYTPTWTQVKTVVGSDTSSCAITGLTTGQNYYFRIRGYTTTSGGSVNGDASSQVVGVAKPNAPAPFTVASKAYNYLLLTWNAVRNADGYEVYRSTSSAASSFVKIRTVADTGASVYYHSDLTVTAGITYYYRVIAYTNNTFTGRPVYSSYSSIKSAYARPVAPTAVSVVNTSYNGATLQWNTVTGATGYDILMSTTQTGTYSQVATVSGSSTNTGSVTGLTTGQTVYFKVRAYRLVNGNRVSGDLSTSVSVTPMPGATTLSGKNLHLTGIQLSWTAVSGAAGYTIYSSTTSGSGFSSLRDVTNATTVTQVVEAGRMIYYKIAAYCYVNGVKTYGADSNEFALQSKPAKMAFSAVTPISQDSIKLHWNVTADVAGKTGGFAIYRSTNRYSGFVRIDMVTRTDITSYVDTGLSLGTIYYYGIQSYVVTNYGTVFSPFSVVASGYTLPAKPTNLTVAQNTPTSLKLNWQGDPIGVNGYEIYYSTAENGTYIKLGATPSALANPSFTTPSTLIYGKTYYFKVRAYLLVGGVTEYGPFGDIASGKTVLPKPSSIVAQKITHNSATLYWSSVTGAEGYHIYYSTSPNDGYSLLGSTSATVRSFVVNNLAVGVRYYFKACAFKMAEGQQRGGALSSYTSALTIPAAPTGLKTTVLGYRSIRLDWNATSGAAGYSIYRRKTGSGNAFVVAATNIPGSATSYTFTNQETGEEFDYYICAYANSSSGKVMGAASATVKGKPCLLATSNLTATFYNPASARLNWNKVANASGYFIQEADASVGVFTTIATLQSPETVSYSTSLSAYPYGTKLLYRIIAFYFDANTSVRYSGFISKQVSVVRLPTIPTGVNGSRTTATTCRVSWDADSSATGFWVYRSDSINGAYTCIGKVGKATGMTIAGLKTGKTYYFKIKACYNNGTTDLLSDYSSVITINP